MFNDLSTNLKKMIFARVRLMDLYEVSVVSQEWWALTMATYNETCGNYNSFLTFQVELCNKMMPQDEGWENWMFIEFTDDKSICLSRFPDKKMIEYFRRKGIRVRKLIYFGDPSILQNLKQSFAHLQTLNFSPIFCYNHDKAVCLPDGLKHLRLNIDTSYLWSHLLLVFNHLERVGSLCIENDQRILFDRIRFDKLKYLCLDISEQSTDDVKSVVTGSKQLSIVHLKHGLIDKEWLGLFPTNIMKIHLQEMRFDKSLLPLFGTRDAFIERQLMRFVCQDWTETRLFKFSSFANSNFYDSIYICRPQTLEEELEIALAKGETPSGLFDNGKLQLKVLKVTENLASTRHFDVIVPKTVKHFEWTAYEYKAINFGALFQDISAITTLRINILSMEEIQFSDFSPAVNLVSLDISLVDDMILGSILRNCPSLKQLSLKCPQEMTFGKLPAELKSFSVKQLKVTESNDPFVNILGHFPSVVDLHLQDVNMATVTIVDLAKLARMGFVRISFKNVNDFVALLLLVVNLHFLPFSHLIMGYSRLDYSLTNERFSCVMGREKAFLRRYSSSDSKHDFTEMNIRYLGDCFDCESLLYCKGLPISHLRSSSESFKITYDLHEFIANGLFEIVQENNSH